MDPMGYINVSLSPLFPKYVFWSISKPLIDSAKIVTLHSPTVSTNAMQLKGFLYFWWVQRSWGVTLENKSFWKLMEIPCFGGVVILASIWGGGWWGERLFVNQVIIWSSKIRLANHPPLQTLHFPKTNSWNLKIMVSFEISRFPSNNNQCEESIRIHRFLEITVSLKKGIFFSRWLPPPPFRWTIFSVKPPCGWNSAHDDRNQLVSMPSQNLRGKARCLYHKHLS